MSENDWENITITEHVERYIEEGMDAKEAIRQTAKDRNIPKRDVYREYHKIGGERYE